MWGLSRDQQDKFKIQFKGLVQTLIKSPSGPDPVHIFKLQQDSTLHALSPLWRGLYDIYYQQLHTREVGIQNQQRNKKDHWKPLCNPMATYLIKKRGGLKTKVQYIHSKQKGNRVGSSMKTIFALWDLTNFNSIKGALLITPLGVPIPKAVCQGQKFRREV